MFGEQSLPYLLDVFTVLNLTFLLVGVTVGLIVGAIPGLSPPMAIALMIPLSFNLPAETALILLVSCYASGIYAGSFSAILMRAPGTSASAASAIEGYEMTKRGKAIEALRISTFASVVGGLISGFVLLFLAPPLAKISLWFGPSEYFLLAILGLIAIAAVSFDSLLKGIISGFFGLFLSTVGIDLYSGFPRFTHGLLPLESGLTIMPAIIGLFAFAQGLELSEGKATKNISGVSKLSWNLWPKISEISHVKYSLLRGWAIGLIMGAIPAAGASVAQWIAYGEEIRRAKPGDKFGKGEVKGLAACEGSNNSTTGTCLVPMFVLGIPGGISAAVILGALMIHGLSPGLGLFKNSPHIVYPVIWGFILANIVMGVVAIFLARIMAYLTLVPRGIISPLILLFSVIGVYAGSQNIYDVWIMCVFGILGYYMFKHGFVPAATLLGIILGPIAEKGFRDLSVVSHGSPITFVLSRPLNLVILALIGLSIYYALKPKSWEETETEQTILHEEDPNNEET